MSEYERKLFVSAKILGAMIASAPLCDRTKISKKKWSRIATDWADILIKEAAIERKKK